MNCELCDAAWALRLDRGQKKDLITRWLCNECITVTYGQLVIQG
jgi:hypothetical protein